MRNLGATVSMTELMNDEIDTIVKLEADDDGEALSSSAPSNQYPMFLKSSKTCRIAPPVLFTAGVIGPETIYVEAFTFLANENGQLDIQVNVHALLYGPQAKAEASPMISFQQLERQEGP
ncbi:hypothetical protein NDU88_001634 [Pleurodeles waltl]|uniref:Uncharacterized protein n=1 Tax=Pleurodeles waltl TaxID=8319 RepID=A0AAV7MPA8_PLEWA|nr:hypothetical protein NDU88_001634 [Pleurodeles waltl]